MKKLTIAIITLFASCGVVDDKPMIDEMRDLRDSYRRISDQHYINYLKTGSECEYNAWRRYEDSLKIMNNAILICHRFN